jgi:dienelactone hydrolase
LRGYLRWREERLARREDSLRSVEPFEVGFELLAAQTGGVQALEAIRQFSLRQVARSDAFFAVDESATEFVHEGDRLIFTSPIATETPANDRVVCRVFEGHERMRAVVVVPHWNAPASAYDRFGNVLRSAGIAAVVMSLPYHAGRRPAPLRLASPMVSANLGRTIRSCRQAVLESRLVVRWLERRGFRRIGIIGASLGSSIASIVAAHDARVRTLALLLTAGHFGEVVWTGRATRHIRQAMEERLTLKQLNDIWSVISPISYVNQLVDRNVPILVVSGRADAVFHPELTARFIDALEDRGMTPRWRVLPCGHYTLGTFPFSLAAAGSVLCFLRDTL